MKYCNQLFLSATFLIATLFYTTAQAAEDQYFNSNGVNIRYQVLGSGAPVILVHGFTADFESNWSSVIDVLTSHFQVIGIDARGHGKSDKPHDAAAYGIQMAIDVANLMDHLGIDKAHVAGYSMGGIIALKMASIYPDRLYSAVTAGSGMWTHDGIEASATAHKATMQRAIDQNISVVDAQIPPGYEFPPSMEEMIEIMRSLDNDPRALLAVQEAIGRMMIGVGDAAAIHVPLLAIYGSLDDITLKTVDRLKAAAPNTEVIVIEGEDHMFTPYAPTFALALRDYFLRIGE